MYLQHLHNFRGVAICGIVGAHALHNFTWDEHSLWFRVLDTAFNQSSVWFFFIAGFLFQYLSPKYATRKYYIGKIKNVILPYIIMSIPALYVFTIVMQQDSMPVWFYDQPTALQIVEFLVTGKHLAPFWFVPTITLIYILAPLLIWLDRKIWPYLALPALMALSAWLGRSGLLVHTPLDGMYSPLSKAVYLFSVYYFGMFLGRYHNKLLEVMPRLWVPLAITAGIAFVANVVTFHEQVHWMYVFKMSTCPLLVYALHVWDRYIPKSFDTLGSISFGLFFIHGYVLAAHKIIWQAAFGTPTLPNSIVLYVVFTALVLGLCTATLVVAQKTLGRRSRMLVGC